MDLQAKAKQDSEDQQLIQQGGASLELAISNIYMRYAKDIQSYCIRRGFNTESAEDILQLVFIKLLKKKKMLSDVKMLGPWLWSVVRTTLIDYTRRPDDARGKDKISIDDVENTLIYSEKTDQDDLKNCVESCFHKMAENDEQRAYALRLAVKYEWDNEQLSTYLGKETRHATSEYISQSRKKIKPCLEKCRELQ